MFKKINNFVFILLFLAVLFVPLLFTTWESGGVSEDENRNLAAFPVFVIDGHFNASFTKDFETWFMDHMGFRQELIEANQQIQQNIFDRSITNSDLKIGKTGDIIYATEKIIQDYAHVNLRTDEEVAEIGNSYQAISDWLTGRGISFYYVQCVDKQTIYPERFIPSVLQIGDISKTDQVIHYLQEQTTVNTIYFKQVLNENKHQHAVFSHWGDSTHWTPRGAYLSYVFLMERINEAMEQPLKILAENDYEIAMHWLTGPDGSKEQIELFNIRDPKAQKCDVSVLGKWAEDYRHSVWRNPEADNDKRLLLMCDSYFEDFLIDDIAESFSEVWLIWGDYTISLPELVELYSPDIVIYECAERVDRSKSVCTLAQNLKNN